ncbi:phosphatase PAP2 family protein [Phaeacidiphilus oryzae]|uniref:phosphatase PAP2 family protein n=1 Tax=Phaeacidiphilus oryzae TaxID=348818 RepID=UPI001F240E45|nr:phosphatase PAP2 family protein [Phaeacidiphilus oryzae]
MRSQRNEGAVLDRPASGRNQRPPSPELRWPPLSRTHKILFAVTIACYLAITVAVLTTSSLVALDWQLFTLKPFERFPQYFDFFNTYVILGQRGPTAILAFAWLFWRAWRTRSWRPPLVMAVTLLLVNVTAGAVKIGIGRLGPHYAHVVGSAALFQGGDIFPSGHTANAVATWGALAYLAVRWRRIGGVIAGFLGVTIGLTTVYLGTHWFSDVLAGWADGALVLLLLPLFEPIVSSTDERLQDWWRRRAELRATALRKLGGQPAAAAAGARAGARTGTAPAGRVPGPAGAGRRTGAAGASEAPRPAGPTAAHHGRGAGGATHGAAQGGSAQGRGHHRPEIPGHEGASAHPGSRRQRPPRPRDHSGHS